MQVRMIVSRAAKILQEFTGDSTIDGYSSQYFQAIQHGKNAAEIRAKILKNFKPEIFSRDWTATKNEWEQSIDKFFIMRFFAQRGIKKQLLQYAVSANMPDAGEVFNLITKFNAENAEALMFKELNDIFDGVDDWAVKEQILRDVLNINSDIRQLLGSPAEYQQLKQNFASLFVEGFTMFRDFYAPKFSQLSTLAAQVDINNAQLLQTAGLQPNATAQDTGSNSLILNRKIILEKIVANIDRLKDWYIYLNVRRKAEGLNLKFATDYIDQTNSKPDTWLCARQQRRSRGEKQEVYDGVR